MKKIIPKTAIIILLLLTAFSCSDNTIAPPELTPGRRDYVWTADTISLKSGFIRFDNMWGSSPNDVWATGNGSGVIIELWHYDGNKWSTDYVGRNIDPNALFGFSSNNVWMGNTNSTLWHYDGFNWSEFGEFTIAGYDEIFFNGIYGDSPNDVYAVGGALRNGDETLGVIMHFDGYTWSFVDIPKMRIQFGDIGKQKETNTYLLNGLNFENGTFTESLFSFSGGKLTQLYTGNLSTEVSQINDDVLISKGRTIYTYSSGSLIQFEEPPPDISFTGGVIWGRSLSDFFVGSDYGIAHYNGTDFKILYKSNLELTASDFAIGNCVFFNLHDNNTGENVIVKGELIN